MHKALTCAQPRIAGHGGLHKDICVQLPFHQDICLASTAQGGGGAACLFLACGVMQGVTRNIPIELRRFGADHIGLADKNGDHDARLGGVFGGFHRQGGSGAGDGDARGTKALGAGNQVCGGLCLTGGEER